MTKDERLKQFERQLRNQERYTESEINSMTAAFSRGYDEGFADGADQRQVSDAIAEAATDDFYPEPNHEHCY